MEGRGEKRTLGTRLKHIPREMPSSSGDSRASEAKRVQKKKWVQTERTFIGRRKLSSAAEKTVDEEWFCEGPKLAVALGTVDRSWLGKRTGSGSCFREVRRKGQRAAFMGQL